MEIVLDNDLFLSDLQDHDFKVSTGSLLLDIFLGGGFGAGVNRFSGQPSHGKTMQCLQWASKWLEHWGDKGRVIYYDTEGRLSLLKLMGSPVSGIFDKERKLPREKRRFIIRRTNIYEDIGDQIISMIKNNSSGLKFFIVFDSLDMMRSSQDVKKTMGEAVRVGGTATVSNNLMKDLGPNLCAFGHHFHILSQVRANINAAKHGGKTTQSSGGWALQHASNLTGDIEKLYDGDYIYADGASEDDPFAAFAQTVRPKKAKKKGGDKAPTPKKKIGHYYTVKFVKTPHDRDNESVSVPIKHNHGVWVEREVAIVLLMYSFARKSGVWYAFDDHFRKDMIEKAKWDEDDFPQRFQGKENFYNFFEGRAELVNCMKEEMTKHFIAKTDEAL